MVFRLNYTGKGCNTYCYKLIYENLHPLTELTYLLIHTLLTYHLKSLADGVDKMRLRWVKNKALGVRFFCWLGKRF